MNMGVLGLVPFGNEDSLRVFLGEHSVCHTGINQAMIDQYGFAPVHYPLDADAASFSDKNSDWLLMHYRIHQSIAFALNLIGGPDLADVNMKSESEFYDWFDAHNVEHEKISQALGLL